MIHAPVVIPTLNRFDHFKECLESLERCTDAEYTDVYVGLDYPPTEKYIEGWKLIDNYLHEKEKTNGFKSLIVYRRETNYFFSGKGNASTIICDLLKKHDCYIFSEDDNIFSPNFLVYINKGLDKFKDDKSVIAINGYCHPYPIIAENNTYFRQNVDFSAWGFGIWKDRVERITKFCRPVMFRKNFIRNLSKIRGNGNYRIAQFFQYCTSLKPIGFTDNYYSVYMALNDMDVIMPTLSLVKNMGWDDSGGMNCNGKNKKLADRHTFQKISYRRDFEYIGNGYENYKDNKKAFVKYTYAKISYWELLWIIIKSLIKYLFLYSKIK